MASSKARLLFALLLVVSGLRFKDRGRRGRQAVTQHGESLTNSSHRTASRYATSGFAQGDIADVYLEELQRFVRGFIHSTNGQIFRLCYFSTEHVIGDFYENQLVKVDSCDVQFFDVVYYYSSSTRAHIAYVVGEESQRVGDNVFFKLYDMQKAQANVAKSKDMFVDDGPDITLAAIGGNWKRMAKVGRFLSSGYAFPVYSPGQHVGYYSKSSGGIILEVVVTAQNEQGRCTLEYPDGNPCIGPPGCDYFKLHALTQEATAQVAAAAGNGARGDPAREAAMQLLGLEEGFDEGQLNKAFRKLAMQWHPDRPQNRGTDREQEATTRFQEYTAAKELLAKTL